MLDVGVPGRLQFRLLGQPLLTACGGPGSIRISAQKGVALLAYLAMHQGRPVNRAILADLLWSDRVDAQARQNLRQLILTLRRDLGPRHVALLQTDDQSMSLATDATDVDAVQFETWAKSRDPAVRARCLDLPWGSFLDGFSIGAEAFDEWAAAERHRLDAIATRVFSDLAKQFDADGDGDRAILAMERLTTIDPADEERLRRLLILEARYRGADAALARAKELVARLKREVDAEPEAETRATIKEIKRRLTSPPDLSSPATRVSLDLVPVFAAATGNVESQRTTPAPWRAREAHCTDRRWIALDRVRRPPVGGGKSQPTIVASSDGPWQSPPLPSAHNGGAERKGVIPIVILPLKTYEDAEPIRMLADMVTDDLTNMLSRVRTFRVISRQTARNFQARSIDIAEAGRELGVRYALEGSIRMSGDKLRASVELTDTTSRAVVWSARVEREDANRHAVQDEIVARLVRELHMGSFPIESARLTNDPDADALSFRGNAALQVAFAKLTMEAYERARSLFLEALQRDPKNPTARLGLGAYHVNVAVQRLIPDPEEHLNKAQELIQGVIRDNPDISGAHHQLGILLQTRGQLKEAIEAFERAIEINPSSAGSHAHIGFALARMGRANAGIEHIRYAMRLSPSDPALAIWLEFAGAAELELDHYEQAIENFRRSIALAPDYPRPWAGLVAAQSLAGDASGAGASSQRLNELSPNLTAQQLYQRFARLNTRSLRLQQGLWRALAGGTDLPPSGGSAAPKQDSAPVRSQGTKLNSGAQEATAPSPTIQQFSDNPTRSNVGTGRTPVVVLPFTAHAAPGDPAHLVADILTDDLAVQLSRIPGLLVTARQSASAYKGKPIDAARIASELQVRYLLEGSVRAQGEGLRINVALIDAANGLHIWNTRFVHEGGDRSNAHDEIVARLARELQVQVYAAEGTRRQDDPDSRLLFKGWDHMARVHHNSDDLESARAAFTEVLERRPRNPRALTGMAAYHVFLAQQLLSDEDRNFAAAEAMLLDAVVSGRPSPATYSLLGQIHLHYGRIDAATKQFEAALAIDPNNASVHAQMGNAFLHAGRLDQALERFRLAMRLSPNDPRMPTWLGFAAEGELERGDVEAAIGYLQKAKESAPLNIHILGDLAAAYALAGRSADAGALLAELRQVAPHLSDAKLIDSFGGNNPHRARIIHGMRQALAMSLAVRRGE